MDAIQVQEHGEDEVIRRMRRNMAGIEQRADPSSSNVARKPCVAETRDRGRNKLEEERRSVAKWEQQKRNNAGDSHDTHHS